jgi:hypothetical protein
MQVIQENQNAHAMAVNLSAHSLANEAQFRGAVSQNVYDGV